MRTMIRALAVSAALIVTESVAPAMEQSETSADVGARATNTGALSTAAPEAPTVSNSAPPATAPPGGVSAAASASAPTPVSKADVKKAISRMLRAYRSNVPCRDVARCATYFESFGVALTFSDGTIAPLAHEQRLERSGRDCIQEARAARRGGNRALAVQWVMAAYMDDPLTRNWLADHPDAVLEGLHHFGD
jgi:hypothetical protein